MNSFLQRHASIIIGVLCGWDRLQVRGTLQWLAHARGMMGFLSYVSVLLKDFKTYALSITAEMRVHADTLASACFTIDNRCFGGFQGAAAP